MRKELVKLECAILCVMNSALRKALQAGALLAACLCVVLLIKSYSSTSSKGDLDLDVTIGRLSITTLILFRCRKL